MSVISTKITPPRQGQALVKRTRLLNELTAQVARNLTLVHAPAGYGKTTLLYQYRLELIDCGYLVAWYSLDQDDNEQITFLEYLTTALEHVLNRRLLPGSRHMSGLAGIRSIKSDLSRVLNELAKTGQSIALIFDDFHTLDDPNVLAAAKMLIEYAPENLHISIGSRAKLPFPTTNLFAQGKAVEFNAEDLRFRIEETETYFETTSKLSLSPLQIYAIQGSTEGWAAGLQLTSLALKRKTISDDLIASIAKKNKTVKNFLAEQVLDSQCQELREFLLFSSILSKFNADICNAIMEIDNSYDIIKKIDEANLFLFSLSEDGHWFRYHHSFSNFLLSRLQEDYPHRVSELHIRACRWFNDHGYIPEAITHAIEAEDYQFAKELLARHAMALVEQGKTTTLLAFMNRIPNFGSDTAPTLTLAVAWSLILVRKPDDAMALLEQVRQAQQQIDPALEVRIEAARLTAMCWQDRPIEAKSEIRDLLATGKVVDPWDYGVLNNNLIYASIFDGQIKEAERAYREFLNTEQSLYTTVYSKALTGNCLKIKGHLYDAATLFQHALDMAEREAGPQSPAAALAAANLAEILYEWNDQESVHALLEGRLEVIDETSLNDVLFSVYRPLIRIYCDAKRWEEAHELIGHVLRIAREQPYGMRLEASIRVEELRLLLMQGKKQAAANRLDQLDSFIASLDLASDWVAERLHERGLLAQAYLAHAQSRYGDAITALEAVCAFADAWGNTYHRLGYNVFRAINMHALGRREEAFALAGEMLQMAETAEMIRSLTDYGPAVRALLEDILNSCQSDRPPTLEGLDPDYITGLLKVIEKSGENGQQMHPSASMPQPVSARAEPPVRLTNRQIEILQLIARGLSNKEIAASLFIALDTVKWHLKIIYTELDVNSRTQAIVRGKETGLI